MLPSSGRMGYLNASFAHRMSHPYTPPPFWVEYARIDAMSLLKCSRVFTNPCSWVSIVRSTDSPLMEFPPPPAYFTEGAGKAGLATPWAVAAPSS